MEYPKINSLWKREDTPKKPLIRGDWACEEFKAINHWRVTEKIDGMNIRIAFTRWPHLENQETIDYYGRTNDAQIPPRLLKHLGNHFTYVRLREVFPITPGTEKRVNSVVLFGEGYGPKIQSGGGNYRKDQGFVLFDVKVDGWWLKHEDVKEIALKLQIPVVPDLGVMTPYEIEEFVKRKEKSWCSETSQVMEGVVARSEPLMLFRNGNPLMFKLKCKDFV